MLAEECDRENLLLKRGRACSVVMNRYPYTNGHLLVFPHRHVAGFEHLETEEKIELMDRVAHGVAVLRQAIQPEGFNVGVNLGKVAGAGLAEHLHVHIVPRWEGDTNFMPILDDVRVIPQSLLALWDELQPLFEE